MCVDCLSPSSVFPADPCQCGCGRGAGSCAGRAPAGVANRPFDYYSPQMSLLPLGQNNWLDSLQQAICGAGSTDSSGNPIPQQCRLQASVVSQQVLNNSAVQLTMSVANASGPVEWSVDRKTYQDSPVLIVDYPPMSALVFVREKAVRAGGDYCETFALVDLAVSSGCAVRIVGIRRNASTPPPCTIKITGIRIVTAPIIPLP